MALFSQRSLIFLTSAHFTFALCSLHRICSEFCVTLFGLIAEGALAGMSWLDFGAGFWGWISGMDGVAFRMQKSLELLARGFLEGYVLRLF